MLYAGLIWVRCRSGNGVQELIVITVIAAIEGGLKMPSVTSGEELRTALNRLGAIRQEQVCALQNPTCSSTCDGYTCWRYLVCCSGLLHVIHQQHQHCLGIQHHRLSQVLFPLQTMAVEVLWTPQDESDYYTGDEVFADYPTLNNL